MDKTKSVSPRTSLHIEVEYRKSYGRENATGILKNISLSGANLKQQSEPLRTGEKLVLTFKVSGRERSIHAEVIWTNSKGSGIKFMPQNNRDTQIIDDLIYFVQSKKSGQKEILEKIFSKVA